MESNKNNWTLGEIVELPRINKVLKQSYKAKYETCIGSRYVCVREEGEMQRGILVKMLEDMKSDHVKLVCGEPFSKDIHFGLLDVPCYSSYPFPLASEVKEVLGILRDNNKLLKVFEEAEMPINPNNSFWVRETVRNVLWIKIPQVYSGCDGKLYPATNKAKYCRMTMAYFYKGQLTF